MLKAIDEKLLSMGVNQKDTPKEVEECRKVLQKHASPHNGKLLGEFNNIFTESCT